MVFGGMSQGLSASERIADGVALSIGLVDGKVAQLMGTPMGCSLSDDEQVLYVHEYGGEAYAIVMTGASGSVKCAWVKLNKSGGQGERRYFDYLSDKLISDVKGLGASLVFATDAGIVVYSLDVGGYVLRYGGAIAMPKLEFAVVGGDVSYAIEPISFDEAARGEVEAKQKAWGAISALYRAMTDKNRFVYSFVLRWAIQLYDGTYVNHSSPIVFDLMNGRYPAITQHDGEVGVRGLQFKLAIRNAEEGFNVNAFFANELIKSIDVFVTAPILPYDASKDGLRTSHTVVGSASQEQPLTGGYYNDDPNQWPIRGERSSLRSSQVYHVNGFSVNYEELYIRSNMGHGRAINAEDTPTPLMDRVMRSKVNNVYRWSERAGSVSWLYPSAYYDSLLEKLSRESVFYLLKSYDHATMLSEVSSVTWRPLVLDDGALSTLTTQKILPNAYRSGTLMTSGRLSIYNNRVHRWGMYARLRMLYSMESEVGNEFLSDKIEEIKARVHVRYGGRVLYMPWSGYGKLSRHVYIPIDGAYLLEVAVKVATIGWRRGVLRLVKHPSLGGSYGDWGVLSTIESWGNSCNASVLEELGVEEGQDTFSLPTLLQVSEYNNPLSWPALGEIEFSDTIVGVGVNTRAVSEGQFGQYPLLAFTEDGIYSLAVGSSGWYVSKQPISREVCSSVNSICSVDDGVVFTTKHGLKAVYGGRVESLGNSSNGCTDALVPLVDAMLSHDVLDSRMSIDSPRELVEGLYASNTTHGVSIPDFLQAAHLSYDAVNRRLYAINNDITLCLSLATERWSVMNEWDVSLIDQWPYMYGVWRSNNQRVLARIDHRDGTLETSSLVGVLNKRVCVLTNALDFGVLDLKALTSLELIGHGYQGANMEVWLWGSNDGLSWEKVTKGVGWRIGRVLGRSFRYWRLGVLAHVSGLVGFRLGGARVKISRRYHGRYRR